MSNRWAASAGSRFNFQAACSVVRQSGKSLGGENQIVAVNLLMQKRVGPLMMYSKSHFARRLPVMRTNNTKETRKAVAGFTLAEVVVCLAIVALVFGGIITGYMQGAYRAEWAGYNLAAQSLAMQQIEQAKTAVWDKNRNEFTNLLTVSWGTLDLPISGNNRVYATNYVTVSTNVAISFSPDVIVQMVKVDTVWPYIRNGQVFYYTNTVADYYAPD